MSGVFVASRLACEGLRSGPGDSDPNDGPTARFAAEAARYGNRGEPALRSEQALPAMGCAAARGNSEPNDGPAARFAAEAARYERQNGGEPALRSEQALPAMGCAAAPAILSRTTVLRPVSQPRLLATKQDGGEPALRSEQALPAMGCAAAPGDSGPSDGPAARFAAEAARYGSVVNGPFVASRPRLRWAAQRPRRF